MKKQSISLCVLTIIFLLFGFRSYSQGLVIEEVKVPTPKTSQGLKEKISLKINNSTAKEFTDIKVELSVSGDKSYTVYETISKVNPSESIEFSLNTEFDLSKDGVYEFNASILKNGNRISNEAYANTVNLPVYKGDLPIKFDFEAFKTCEVFDVFLDETRLPGIAFYTNNTDAKMSLGPGQKNNYKEHLNYFILNENSETNFIFTADLEAYSVHHDDLILEVEFFNLDYDNEKVLVRGSEQDQWIAVNSYKNINLEFKTFSISSLLRDNNQEFSSTTQILFRSTLGEIEEPYVFNSSVMDNLKIYFKPQFDVAIEKTIIPTPKFRQSQNEEISVVVINTGTKEISNIPVKCQVNSPSETINHSEVIEQTIAPGDTFYYTFERKFDFSQEGHYYVEMALELSTDEDFYNNKFVQRTIKFNSYKGDLPLIEDFNDVFAVCETQFLADHKALPGFSFYGDSEPDYISFDQIDYINKGTATISANKGSSANMILTLDLEKYFDRSEDIMLSFDLPVMDPYYNEDDPVAIDVMVRGNEADEWLPLNMNYHWIPFLEFNLTKALRENGQEFSALTQILFRIPQETYNGWTSNSFTIDNINVHFQYSLDIEATELLVPEPDVNFSNTNDIKVVIVNEGKEAIENVPISFEVHSPNGEIEYFQDVYKGIINAKESVNFTANNSFKLTEEGEYLVKATVNYPDDQNQNNNVIEAKIIKPHVYRGSFPVAQTFEKVEPFKVESSATNIGGLDGFTAITDNGVLGVESHSEDNNLFNFHCIYNGEAMLLFTADLAGKNLSSIILEAEYLDVYKNGLELWYRGSANEPWITENYISESDEFTKLEINLLEKIKENGQEVDNTFQIGFVIKNNNIKLDNILVDVHEVTSIKEENDYSGLLVYPNPSSGIIHLKSEELEISSVRLFNTQGMVLKSINDQVNELNISDLNNGLYILQVEINNKIFVKQIIKN